MTDGVTLEAECAWSKVFCGIVDPLQVWDWKKGKMGIPHLKVPFRPIIGIQERFRCQGSYPDQWGYT